MLQLTRRYFAQGQTFQSKNELALVFGIGLHEGNEGPGGLVHHATVVALPVSELRKEIRRNGLFTADDFGQIHGVEGDLLVEFDKVDVRVFRREQEKKSRAAVPDSWVVPF